MIDIETDYEDVETEEARPHEQQTGAYIMVVCAHCGKLFAARRRRKARRRYCSAACYGKAWRKARLEAQTCESAPTYISVAELRAERMRAAKCRKAALRKSDRAWKKVATTKRRLSDGCRTIEYRGWGFGSAAKLSK